MGEEKTSQPRSEMAASTERDPVTRVKEMSLLKTLGSLLRGDWLKRSATSEGPNDLGPTIYVCYLLVGAGIGSIAWYAGSASATPLLAALACLAVGAVTGFLFGIPRILQGDNPASGTPEDKSGYRQQVNTNLEQISDWLTKIIVGLGLIELRSIPGHLMKVAAELGKGIGHSDADASFAAAIIVYFAIIGFLFGYLMTRLFLAAAFSRADQAAVIRVVQEVKRNRVAIKNLAIVSMSDEIYKNLKKINTGNFGGFHPSASFKRELNFLRDAGYIRFKKSLDGIPSNKEMPQLSEYVEATDEGKDYVRVREEEKEQSL